MKKKSSLIITALLFVCTVAMSQDYYSGKTTVKASSIVYSIENNMGILALENVNNVLLKTFPYNTEKQQYYRYNEIALLSPPQEEFRNVVAPILNPENVTFDTMINIVMAIDPLSGIVKEVRYSLWPEKNASVLSLPPERFEELEKRLVGGDFGFIVPDVFKVATYIQGYYLYKF